MSNRKEQPDGIEHVLHPLDGPPVQPTQTSEGDGMSGVTLDSPKSVDRGRLPSPPEASHMLIGRYGSAPGPDVVSRQIPSMRNAYEATTQSESSRMSMPLPLSSNHEFNPYLPYQHTPQVDPLALDASISSLGYAPLESLDPSWRATPTSLGQFQDLSGFYQFRPQADVQQVLGQSDFQNDQKQNGAHHAPGQKDFQGGLHQDLFAREEHLGGFDNEQHQDGSDNEHQDGFVLKQSQDLIEQPHHLAGLIDGEYLGGFDFEEFEQQQDQIRYAQHQKSSKHPQFQGGSEHGKSRDTVSQATNQADLQHKLHHDDLLFAESRDPFLLGPYQGNLRPLQLQSNAQPSQAQGQPVQGGVPNLQLPPLDLDNKYFENTKLAKFYLQRPFWRPTSELHGVPRQMDERLLYVKRIYDAIVDISHIQDADMWREEGAKFKTGGMWAHPKDIEAISHEVVDTAMKVHRIGVHGLRFSRDTSLLFCPYDAILTFSERLYLVAYMLRHFKLKADAVMQGNFIEAYVARVWSELKDQPSFRATWGSWRAEQILAQLDVAAYQDVPQKPPSRDQRAEFLRRLELDAPSIKQEVVQEQLAEDVEGPSLPPRKRRHTDDSS